MSGVLYIVATPIGNLDDISLRAIATLQAVDWIAAEDTRHSRHLLRHLAIDKPMLSCHEHNEQARSGEIIGKLEGGADVALISDAGTPLISDPGYRLVRAVSQAGYRITPIPGASSLITALCAAGLPTERFYFSGFLASKAKQRLDQLMALAEVRTTLVLFESSHRIVDLLSQLQQVFAENDCVIGKELSKLHEQFLRGKPAELLARFEFDPSLTRGEFVVLIDNSKQDADERLSGDDRAMLEILLDELTVKMAVKIATRLTGKKKNEIYPLALTIDAEKNS